MNILTYRDYSALKDILITAQLALEKKVIELETRPEQLDRGEQATLNRYLAELEEAERLYDKIDKYID